MANTDSPQGLRPRSPYAKTHKYVAATAASIFRGDPVKLENDGNITVAAAGNGLLGVAGAIFSSTGTPMTYHTTANAAGVIHVYDDPDEIFIIQDDATGTASAVTHVGNQADHITYAAGNTDTGQSIVELDISTVVAATPCQFQILGLADEYGAAGKNAWGSWAELLVRISEHQYGATGRIGV